MKCRYIWLAGLMAAVFLCGKADAQNFKSYILEDVTRSAGYFHYYEVPENDMSLSCPEGYEPFYISHFGRHGCRWHTSGSKYESTLAVLQEAEKRDLLTADGERFLADMTVLTEDARGMLGELSPRGVREHKGLAHRMYERYPEIFQPGARIESRSTQVVRVILSMAAFDEGLKEKEPGLLITRGSGKRDYADFRGVLKEPYKQERYDLLDSLKMAWLDEGRFMENLFKDGGKFIGKSSLEGKFKYPEEFMYNSFEMASIAQCCNHLGLNMYYLFTEDEIYELWKCINAHGYLSMGPAYKYGDYRLENAKPLLKEIIDDADAVINGKSDLSASLRFGHDSNIMPLLALMGVEGTDARVRADEVENFWNVTEVSPMATNMQFIFFKNQEGRIKTRVLFRETDAKLPLEGGPFYDWEELKSYFQSRIDKNWSYRNVGVEEFLKAAKADDVTLIDVRTPAEHAAGCIPGTTLNIDVKDSSFAEEAVKQLPAGSKVAIYCRSGKRSKVAAKLLNEKGFEVVELCSGYNGYKEWSAKKR